MAVAARDRSHGGQTRKPIFTHANNLRPHIGQDEIDGCRDGIGVGIEAQDFVGRAVGTGRVRAHAKAVGDRLKVFLFFVDRVPAAPPPCLMDKRAVCRIHQSDDSVIDAAWQISSQICDFVMLAEFFDFGSRRWRGSGLGKAGAGETGIRNEYPNEIVAFFAGITAGIDAIDFQFLIGDQRWNQRTLSGVRVEPPAVIRTLHLCAVQLSAGKRHAAVRTGIAESERSSGMVAAHGERRFEQHRFHQLAAAEFVGRQCAIPKAEQHE